VFAIPKKEIVVTIGGHPISREEFEANYRKNNSNILYEKDKKTPADYLGLYINFKLKVLEAQRLGYDTAKAFVDELKGYRKELVKPYMTNVAFNDEMVQTEYHRTQHERKASHLLIRIAPDASPADTLAAWNKINDLRKKIVAGADFNETAARYSEDPSAAQNKGLLGYFSAFQMVYPFEDMTYRTPVGQVSEIVRTQFGYHLIKVHDERVAPGELKVAHIMKMFPQQASEETIAKLKLSADSIWQKAVAGADFAELAKKYSDDKQSAPSGGILNWFTQTNMIPAFAEAAFALKNDGDISPVIRTPYGWHIIKRLELRKTLSLEKLRPELEDKIKKNPSISKYSDEAFDRELRAEYHLNIDENNFRKLLAAGSDSVKRAGLFSPENQQKDNALFTFANRKYTTSDFTDYLKSQNYSPVAKNHETDLKARLDKFINLKLLAYEDSQLERKHPDFARIYQEYHDGILLFNISKDKIWDAASSDTARLQNYFDHTTKKHFWNDRFKGWIIEAKDAETRTKIETMLDQKEMGKEEISDIFNTKTDNAVKITGVAVEKGDNPVVDYFIWSGPKPEGFNETTTFVHGKIAKDELKDLKDAWGLYSSDFQDEIEKEWIASLHKKYPVVINKRVLKKIPAIE
jgi:peptidyl-prolyl cis-trans isomerase SurA